MNPLAMQGMMPQLQQMQMPMMPQAQQMQMPMMPQQMQMPMGPAGAPMYMGQPMFGCGKSDAGVEAAYQALGYKAPGLKLNVLA